MLKPKPDNSQATNTRQKKAQTRRRKALAISGSRRPQISANNNEIERLDHKPTNFHKGLPHDQYGRPDPRAFADLIKNLNRDGLSDGRYAKFNVALGPRKEPTANPGSRTRGFAVETFHSLKAPGEVPSVRNWESPLAGHAYSLEGPDAGDLAMAPAPTLAGNELAAEMAEVYALALLRDVPFSELTNPHAAVQRYTLCERNGKVEVQGYETGFTVAEVIEQLGRARWFRRDDGVRTSYEDLGINDPTEHELARRRARFGVDKTRIDGESVFRGSSPGCKDGPYISQFLLIGNPSRGRANAPDGCSNTGYTYDTNSAPAMSAAALAKDNRAIPRAVLPVGVNAPITASGSSTGDDPMVAQGYVSYGAQRIDQRINAHLTGRDYMTDWSLWLDVQNGADMSGTDAYMPDGNPRFIATPRDLATFVHFDQLYQAYLNACLLMFSYGVGFDQGFPSGNHITRGSFATFGGPHVLSLLSEVASRALKAVRRQKFQQHLRGRPEQLGAMMTLAASDCGNVQLGNSSAQMQRVLEALREESPKLLDWIDSHNRWQNEQVTNSPLQGDSAIYPRRCDDAIQDASGASATPWKHFEPENGCNYLLPMAFPEGSPMHASYGAGHATVAGACTTVLKGFFELSIGSKPASLNQALSVAELKSPEARDWWTAASMGSDGFGLSSIYQAPSSGDHSALAVDHATNPEALTIEGELNKLAANIAIGRDMAGVHFYTDYYDSLRMGERLAVGILEEQMSTYPESLSMRLKSFDGDAIIIHGDGKKHTGIEIGDADGSGWETDADEISKRAEAWWHRHTREFEPEALKTRSRDSALA